MVWVKAKEEASLKPFGHVGTVRKGRVVNLDADAAGKAVESGAFKPTGGPRKARGAS